MVSQFPITTKSITYSPSTIDRAERALICSPFNLALFSAMTKGSVSIMTIAGSGGLQTGYTRQLMSELAAETALVWLINVGMLRREVDGQGLTDSFRLTPLGYLLVEKWEGKDLRKPSLFDRVKNFLDRWFHLPF